MSQSINFSTNGFVLLLQFLWQLRGTPHGVSDR